MAMNFPADFAAAADTMPAFPFLCGRRAVVDATALAREFGADAALAASLRAQQSRARDNKVSFCHWREVERLVEWFGADGDAATRH
jgi:hypothetical protein